MLLVPPCSNHKDCYTNLRNINSKKALLCYNNLTHTFELINANELYIEILNVLYEQSKLNSVKLYKAYQDKITTLIKLTLASHENKIYFDNKTHNDVYTYAKNNNFVIINEATNAKDGSEIDISIFNLVQYNEFTVLRYIFTADHFVDISNYIFNKLIPVLTNLYNTTAADLIVYNLVDSILSYDRVHDQFYLKYYAYDSVLNAINTYNIMFQLNTTLPINDALNHYYNAQEDLDTHEFCLYDTSINLANDIDNYMLLLNNA